MNNGPVIGTCDYCGSEYTDVQFCCQARREYLNAHGIYEVGQNQFIAGSTPMSRGVAWPQERWEHGQSINFAVPVNEHVFTLHRNGQALVTVKPDGTLEYGEGYTPDEAARTFWDALAHAFPGRTPKQVDEEPNELVEFFRTGGLEYGLEGDSRGWSTERTAIEVILRLRKQLVMGQEPKHQEVIIDFPLVGRAGPFRIPPPEGDQVPVIELPDITMKDLHDRFITELRDKIQEAVNKTPVPGHLTESRAEYFKAGCRAVIAVVSRALREARG